MLQRQKVAINFEATPYLVGSSFSYATQVCKDELEYWFTPHFRQNIYLRYWNASNYKTPLNVNPRCDESEGGTLLLSKDIAKYQTNIQGSSRGCSEVTGKL